MANLEYLKEYYPFSDATIAAVDGAITYQEGQQRYFSELTTLYNVDNAHIRTNVDGKPIEYLHLKDYGGTKDRDTVRVMFTPEGYSVSNHAIVMRALRVFEADRAGQLFVAAGPLHSSSPYNGLELHERHAVRNGNFAPVARPILQEMAKLGVKHAAVLGSSLGAAVGLSALQEAANVGITIQDAVLAEPINVTNRSPFELVKAVKAASARADEYNDQSGSTQLKDAIRLDNMLKNYRRLIPSPSSIAINLGLSKGTFEADLNALLSANESIKVVTAYGTASELSEPQKLRSLHEHELSNLPTDYRMFDMPLEDAHNAWTNNINLHAAIAVEGFNLLSGYRSMQLLT